MREFGNISPNSPNLRRRMDPDARASALRSTKKIEDDEKKVRALESISAIAPSRGGGGGGGKKKLNFAFSADKTVVSLPIKLQELKEMPWYEAEDRLLKEYDKVREVSLKLLFGSQEKEKRIGHGQMEELVFTVAPFKDTRVKLERLENDKEESSEKKKKEDEDEDNDKDCLDSTFYNASWIGRDFIACSMPQHSRARESFWRMIWEYDVPCIVMLNEDMEQAHKHAEHMGRYVPSVLQEWEQYGCMQVLKVEQVTARNMSATVRKLKIRRDSSEEVKEVSHVQYRDWPDGGIPSDRDDYKEFILYLMSLSRSLRASGGGPVVVHCFGGKGRTGTTIATLLELQKIEVHGGDEIDVCGTVSEMRTHRSLLVETVEQYKFISWCVCACWDSIPKPAAQQQQPPLAPIEK